MEYKLIKKIYSYLVRIDNPKIYMSNYPYKFILLICLKVVNTYRWVKAFLIINKVNTLNDFFKEIHIFWNKGNEGHTQQSVDQTNFLADFAIDKKRVFEIGFNGGHSSETFLKSNKNIEVISCDIGGYFYTKFGKFYLMRKYGNRFKLIVGDSKKVVPNHTKMFEDKFDLIYVDGGHKFEDALQDIINCRLFSTEDTYLLVDDVIYNTRNKHDHINSGPSKAWAKLINEGFVSHINNYVFKSNELIRSIVVGKYI